MTRIVKNDYIYNTKSQKPATEASRRGDKMRISIRKEGKLIKRLSNCTIYKGKVVQLSEVGVGKQTLKGGMFGGDGDVWEEYPEYRTVYSALFNSVLVNRDNVAEEIQSIKEWTENSLDMYLQYMIHVGENEGDILVEDMDEVERREAEKEENEFLSGKKAIRFIYGAFGLQLIDRLPSEIWNLIRPFAQYYAYNDDTIELAELKGMLDPDRRDIEGWYYSAEAIDVLLKNNYPVKYRGYDIEKSESISDINSEIVRILAEEAARRREVEEKKSEFQNLINGAAVTEPTPEEIDAIKRTDMIFVLDYTGPDIYGGGKWLHILGDDLFVVKNNGADGDYWGDNNYPTGGAGAICVKKPGLAYIVSEIEKWKNSIEGKL